MPLSWACGQDYFVAYSCTDDGEQGVGTGGYRRAGRKVDHALTLCHAPRRVSTYAADHMGLQDRGRLQARASC
jgi:hypothetical protein